MKKYFVLLLALLLFIPVYSKVWAEEKDQSETITEMIEGIDDEKMQDYVDEQGFGFNIKQTITDIVNGKNPLSLDTFTTLIFSGLNKSLNENMSLICMLIAIVLLSAVVNCLKSDAGGADEVIYYVIAIACISLISFKIVKIVRGLGQAVSQMTRQTEIFMPIVFSMMAISGAGSSVGIYQPVLGVFSQIVNQVVISMLLPLISSILGLSIVDKLTNTAKLDAMKKFMCSVFKWVSGIIFTLYSVMLTVSGISASVYDGIAFKLGKYTVSNMVPIVGGYLSSGLEVIVSSAVLLKNAIGLIGIFILSYTVLNEIIDIIVFSLLLQFVSAITQPVADGRITSLFSSVADGLNYTVALIGLVGFSYLILLTLIICTGNIFL